MKRTYSSLLVNAAVVALLFVPLQASAQAPSLGASANFGVLAGMGVVNIGPTTVTGDLGVSPSPSVVGFPPGIVTGGTIHSNDAVAQQAQSDVTVAYNAVAGTACTGPAPAALGGFTLTPGVYCFALSASLNGTLTLDLQGNPNAVFLFQIGSTLTTATNSAVLLINSGGTTCPPNLYWKVGSSATLGTGSTFAGNILALQSITLATGARLSGRALARNGTVALDSNTVGLCAPVISCPVITVNPATLPNGAVGTAYNAAVTANGGLGPYTFAVTSGALATGLLLTGATGAITGTPTTTGSFNFTITATDTSSGCLGSRAYTVVIAAAACPVITLSPATLPPGAVGTAYSQTISAFGGTAPYTFAFVSGSLPTGLTLSANGALSGTPTTAGSFTFTVRASDAGGCFGSRVYTVVINGPPAVTTFTASPATITAGQSSTLSWTTTNTTSVSISGVTGTQPANGSVFVSPAATTIYTLTATGPGGTATAATTVTVIAGFNGLQILVPGEVAAPATPSGKAGSPLPQLSGTPFPVVINAVDAAFNLVSSATDVVGITSTDPAAIVPTSGPLVGGTRTFSVTLKTSGAQFVSASDLTNPTRSAGTSAAIPVGSIMDPAVALAGFPSGMVAGVGVAGASDHYELINTGGGPTTITLTQAGNFFTQSPTNFTLQPGATQVISLQSLAQPHGSYQGTSIPSGAGIKAGLVIPVQLLSTPPPTGIVSAAPISPRVDLSAPVGTNPTGTGAFTNSGSAVLEGILVSDSAWLIPQSGVITIQPGQTVSVNFTIDRAKRPGAVGPVGSAAGRLSLIFPTGSSSAHFGRTETNDAGATAQVSISIVDLARVPGAPGSIPPLAAGEVALLVPGLPRRSGELGDLSVSNTDSTTSLSDLRLYYVSSFSTQNALVGQVLPKVSVSITDLSAKNAFGSDGVNGGLLLRGTNIDKAAVSATLLKSTVRGTYGNALPIFRSNRAAGAGDTVFLVGLRKDTGVHTNFYLQEVSGSSGSAKIDFFDAQGQPIGLRTPDALSAFGFLELADAVPAGATTARISPLGAARIAAYGLVTDETSGDSWNLVDWPRFYGVSGSTPGSSVVPLLGAAAGVGAQTDLSLMNKASTPNTVILKYTTTGSSHRRAARTGGLSTAGKLVTAPEALLQLTRSVTLNPLSSITMPDLLSGQFALPKDSSGYLTISSTADLAINARTFVHTSQSGTIGTGIPAIPSSSTLIPGESRFFTGIEDASPAAVANRAPATYRTNLGLIETAGQPATVTVTLRYYFPAGYLLFGYAASSKDFALSPGQFLLVTDLMKTVIGDVRNTFGDLHNVQVEIKVSGGNGRVLPLLQTIDNGTADTILHTD
jgi:hypothetical protein